MVKKQVEIKVTPQTIPTKTTFLPICSGAIIWTEERGVLKPNELDNHAQAIGMARWNATNKVKTQPQTNRYYFF